jgi:hypothetical protein
MTEPDDLELAFCTGATAACLAGVSRPSPTNSAAPPPPDISSCVLLARTCVQPATE